MSYFGYADRPNREEEDKSTEDYHVRMGKWAVYAGFNEAYYDFVRRARLNKSFYKGDQWSDQEDIETFLKDETGEDRNRLKIVKNIIRPIIEQYRGNVSKMSVNARVRSVSPNAVDRRDEKLQENLLLTEVTQDMSPQFQEHAKATHRIGETKEETQRIFENIFVDEYEGAMEKLTEHVKNINDFEDIRFKAGEDLSLTGLCVAFPYNHGGHRRFMNVESDRFFWDPSSRKDDFSDGSFWGFWDEADPSVLYERFNVDEEARGLIEQHIRNTAGASTPTIGNFDQNDQYAPQRPTVYYVYWRDYEKYYYGYVENEYGYKEMVRIGIDEDSKGYVYTEEDVVPHTGSSEDKRIFGEKNTVHRVTDVIRYCTMILSEELMGAEHSNERKKKVEERGDIVLDWGMFEWPEPNIYDISEVMPPIKARAWSYIDGHINSPIDDLIDPQRMINRIVSVAESQINNSGGANIMYDKDAVDPQEGEDGLLRDVDQGRPVGLTTRGRGVPNSMSVYDNSPREGTYGLFNLVNTFQQFAQEISGVNKPMQGQETGQDDQLVGVTQMLIQQGSLIQEPFYNSIARFMLNLFQDIVTVGKDYYIDNGGELAMIAGDRGAETLTLTDDMKNEQFAAFIEREASDEAMQQSGNQLLQFLLQSQMIDQHFFAKHYSRSSVDNIMRSLRQDMGEQKVQEEEAMRQQQRAQQQQQRQMRQMSVAQEHEQIKQEAREAEEKERQRQHEIDKTLMSKLGDVIAKGEMEEGGFEG